jgi:hypothetical protein
MTTLGNAEDTPRGPRTWPHLFFAGGWSLILGYSFLHLGMLDEDDDLGTTPGAHSFPFVSRCTQEPCMRWYSSAPIIFSTEEWRARSIDPAPGSEQASRNDGLAGDNAEALSARVSPRG